MSHPDRCPWRGGPDGTQCLLLVGHQQRGKEHKFPDARTAHEIDGRLVYDPLADQFVTVKGNRAEWDIPGYHITTYDMTPKGRQMRNEAIAHGLAADVPQEAEPVQGFTELTLIDTGGPSVTFSKDEDGSTIVLFACQPGAAVCRSVLGMLCDVYGETVVRDGLDIVTAF